MKWWNRTLACQQSLSERLEYDWPWQIDINDDVILLIWLKLIGGGENFGSFNSQTKNIVVTFWFKIRIIWYDTCNDTRIEQNEKLNFTCLLIRKRGGGEEVLLLMVPVLYSAILN